MLSSLAKPVIKSREVDLFENDFIRVRPMVSHKSMNIKLKSDLYDPRISLESPAEMARKFKRIQRARRLATKAK